MVTRSKLMAAIRRRFVGADEFEAAMNALRRENAEVFERLKDLSTRQTESVAENERLASDVVALRREIAVLRTEQRAVANTVSALEATVARL